MVGAPDVVQPPVTRAARARDACLWHVSSVGGARCRGCAAAAASGRFDGLLDSARAPHRARDRRPRRPPDSRDPVRRRRGGRARSLLRRPRPRLVEAAAQAAAREGPLRVPSRARGAAGRGRPRGLPDHGLRRPRRDRRPEREPGADDGLRHRLGRRPVRVAAVRRRVQRAQPEALGILPSASAASRPRSASSRSRSASSPGRARPIPARWRS
jgi:hypothetical protein